MIADAARPPSFSRHEFLYRSWNQRGFFFPENGSSATLVLFEVCTVFMELRTKIQGMTIETQLRRRRTRRQLDKTSKRPRPICAVRF